LIVVDFQAPFGQIKATFSHCLTSKEIFLKATNFSKLGNKKSLILLHV